FAFNGVVKIIAFVKSDVAKRQRSVVFCFQRSCKIIVFVFYYILKIGDFLIVFLKLDMCLL
ncbi:hypothetical protein, partial [Leptospira interrogans]|uniref:hypothetical protein n=1 Tax=Leptospira interrogans TaxID=173 RepID=UPI000774AEBE